MKSRIFCTLLGAAIGAFFGAGTGIAGAFGGIPGIGVFTLLGAIIGFLAKDYISNLLGKLKRK